MTNQCEHGQLARVCELCEKDAEIAALRETQHKFGQVQHDLLTQIDQLRQYLDTAQRRASALGDEVAGLREALHSIAWSRPPGRTSKMVEALEKKALAALAARKGGRDDVI